MIKNKIRVLVVDDSAVARQFVRKALEADSKIEVVAVAHDPLMALDKIEQLKPDAITLDVEMPKMDGITFLRRLMRKTPVPTIMVSALTIKGADVTLQALEMGVVDYVTKPSGEKASDSARFEREIREKVKVAAGVKKKTLQKIERRPPQNKLSADAILEKQIKARRFTTTDKIIALGASTGGTEAIKQFLVDLPANTPGVVISQHIPLSFSAQFARRMEECAAMTVCEAHDGQQICRGHVYIAPGNRHLLVSRKGNKYLIKLSDGPAVNHHKPSVDVMFRSVAQNAGKNSIGIILTGMGDDGASGLKEMQEAGASTIAQDEESSIVWGMPGAAVGLNAANHILPLNAIANKTLKLT